MTWITHDRENLYNKMNDFENLKFNLKEKDNTDSIPLYKCLEYFMKWEELGNSYSYKCKKCKTEKGAKQKIQI